MIIYADIRPLIITGIVLLFTNFGWNYPLPLKRKLQAPGKRMVMTKKSCQDPIGNKGTCMFKYDCIRQKGVTLSTCVDGFLFGACCLLKEHSNQIISDGSHSEPTHLIDYKGPNKTIYNFFQIKSDTSLNISTKHSRPIEKIFNTSFDIFSTENSQENTTKDLLELLHSTENKITTAIGLSDDENNLTTFENVLNLQINKNTSQIPSTADDENFSKSLVFKSTTSFIRPTGFNEESIINNKSLSLYSPLENIMGINRTNISAFPTQTESYPSSAFESSEKMKLEEYINQFTSIHYFDDSSKENNTADITDYLNEWMGNESEISTALNKYIFSDLISTDSSVNAHEPFFQNISVSTENTYELNETTGLTSDNLSFADDNIKIESSEPTENFTISAFENNFLPISENYSTKLYETTNTSEYESLTISDQNFITRSTQNIIVSSTFETPSIDANSEYTSFELSPEMPLTTPVHSKLKEFEEKDLLTTNIASSNLSGVVNITFYDKPSKMSNDLAAISNSNSSSFNLTLDDKKTTKAILLPTLHWASNSILPESFQSVISQLIEQETSSPGNFILDYETHATPAVDPLVDQSFLLDPEESVRIEFKSNNISGFLDGEYDTNIFLSEFSQTSNTELPVVGNFTSTSPTDSPAGLDHSKFDDRNNNSLLVPNVLNKDFTKNELTIKLNENLNTNISSKHESDILSDEHHTTEILHTLEYFKHGTESGKTEVGTFTSSFEQSNPHTKQLESNLNSYTGEVFLSEQTEPYTFQTTTFQNSNYQKEPNMNLLTLEQSDQNYSEPSTSFPTVQSQSLDNTLYNATEFSETLMEETTTNTYPTVIQIINNHAGKNPSTINFLNHMKDTNESHISTVFAQYEENGSEMSSTIHLIVNTSFENGNNLYETETFMNASTPVILNVEDLEESHYVDSSMHLVVNTDSINTFNESLDSSQTTSFEIVSSYIDFNSTNTLPSIFTDNSTSPFTTIAHGETKDTELLSTNFEEHYLNHTEGQSIESTVDSYNIIFTEPKLSTGFDNFSDVISNHITTETKLTNDVFNYSDETSSGDSFNSHVTTELGYTETSVFSTDISEISETVSPFTFPTLSETSPWADGENSTISISSKPADINASDVSVTTSTLVTIPSGSSTNAAFTQNLDIPTNGVEYTNTSDVHFDVLSTGNTTLSTMLTTESPSIQDEAAINVDKLTSLSTQTYLTPVPTTTTVPKVDIHRWNYKKDCGVRLMQPVGRIVGGKNTYFGKWPWQALVKEATWLGLFVKNKCGGVLITSKYVLTAAHCQPGFLASLLVVLGTHDLAETFDNKASVIRNVKRMVVHRHYNAQTFENDLALLEMEAPVEFLPYVVPICLPHRNEDFTGKMAFVTGWGKLTAGGDVPNILQEVQVPIVSNGECQSMFYQAGHHKAIRSNFVCAGYTNGGQDSCEGDSGGPLMVQREDTRWVLVGTVSHGIGCADPNLPGVYMRMSSYRPWIDSIIYK